MDFGISIIYISNLYIHTLDMHLVNGRAYISHSRHQPIDRIPSIQGSHPITLIPQEGMSSASD